MLTKTGILERITFSIISSGIRPLEKRRHFVRSSPSISALPMLCPRHYDARCLHTDSGLRLHTSENSCECREFLMEWGTFTKCLNQIKSLAVVKIKVRKNRDGFSVILFGKQVASKHTFFAAVTGADFNWLFDFPESVGWSLLWRGHHHGRCKYCECLRHR